MKQSALQRAAARPGKLGAYRVLRTEDLDGIKFFLDAPEGGPLLPASGKCGEIAHAQGAEAWVLLRGSGTEPLLRVYAEAASPETLNEILDDAVAFVHEPQIVRVSS